MEPQNPGKKLPTVSGKIHGVVSWEPLAVQCDHCFRVWQGNLPGIVLQKPFTTQKTTPSTTVRAMLGKSRLEIHPIRKDGDKNNTNPLTLSAAHYEP